MSPFLKNLIEGVIQGIVFLAILGIIAIIAFYSTCLITAVQETRDLVKRIAKKLGIEEDEK